MTFTDQGVTDAEPQPESSADPYADAPWATISETMEQTGMAETTLRTYFRTGLIAHRVTERGTEIRPAEAEAVAASRRAKTKAKMQAGGHSSGQETGNLPPNMLPVPADAFTRMMDQVAQLHDAGERAGRAEAAEAFLRHRMSEKDAEVAAARAEAAALRDRLERAQLEAERIKATIEAQEAAEAARRSWWRR